MTLLKKPTNYEIGWQRIWGKKKGFIYLLPSDSTKVIINRNGNNSLSFSSLIPAKSRTVELEYEKYSGRVGTGILETPPFIITQVLTNISYACQINIGYCECFNHATKSAFYIRTLEYLNERYKTCILGIYSLPNLYRDGSICWGGLIKPKSIRHTNTLFWTTPLNNSNGVYDFLKTSLDNENSLFLESIRNKSKEIESVRDYYSEIYGDKPFVSNEKVSGVFVTKNNELINKYRKYAITLFDPFTAKITYALVGVVRRDRRNGIWYVDVGGEYFWLSESQVILQ